MAKFIQVDEIRINVDHISTYFGNIVEGTEIILSNGRTVITNQSVDKIDNLIAEV